MLGQTTILPKKVFKNGSFAYLTKLIARSHRKTHGARGFYVVSKSQYQIAICQKRRNAHSHFSFSFISDAVWIPPQLSGDSLWIFLFALCKGKFHATYYGKDKINRDIKKLNHSLLKISNDSWADEIFDEK